MVSAKSSRSILISISLLAIVYLIYVRQGQWIAKDDNDIRTASVSLGRVLDTLSYEVRASVDRFNQKATHEELGIALQHTSMNGYERNLQDKFEEFLSPSPHLDLDSILDHLSLLPRPCQEIPKTIYTTDIMTPEDFPHQFRSWATINENWQTIYVSDDEIDAWLDRMFPQHETGIVREMKALKRNHGIVRADLFRYLVLLLHGGVYTDTDTACVQPIDNWALSPDTSPLHPLHNALPALLELSGQQVYPTQGSDRPSMILSVEIDAPASGRDWRAETFARGLQIVQWTILSQKAHPILLDVIGHALRIAKSVREAEERGQSVHHPNILDWSGPGAFTDAVMQYLLVRYGVHPKDLSGLQRPKRFGDIVIMPIHSFRADASEGWQGDHRVVWHGFYGRWKEKEKVEEEQEPITASSI